MQLLPSDKRDWRKVPGQILWVYSPLTKRMSSKRMGVPKYWKVCCGSAGRSGLCVEYTAQEVHFISSSVCLRESVSDWCSLTVHIGTHKCAVHGLLCNNLLWRWRKKYFSVINHIFFLVGIRVLHQKHVSVNLCVLSLISVHCLDEYLQKKVILGLENTECNTGLLQKTALPKTV